MPVGQMGHVRAPNKDFLLALSARRHKRALQALLATPPPDNWDSKAHGWVGPVKDQGQCGSCWDFSGTGVVEIAYYKAGLFKPDGSDALSEEYTLSCGRNGGCNGDDNVTVLDWAKATGLPKTKDYGPYTAHAGRCSFQQTMPLYKINDWGFVDGSGGNGVAPRPAIQAAIMQYGCVGSGVAAGGDSFWDSGTGTGTGTSHNIDHDVIITGWRTAGTKVMGAVGSGVHLPHSANPFVDWDMRNSWNTTWGNGGYGWVREGAYDLGNEAVWARVDGAAPPIDWYV